MRVRCFTAMIFALPLLLGACTSSEHAVQTDAVTEPASSPESEGGHHGHHGHHAPIGHTFEEVSKWAERFNDPSRDTWQKPDEVVRLLALEPGMVVADVGAGTGYIEPHLAGAVGEGGKVLALDIEPGMVEYMKKAPHLSSFPQVEPRVVAVDDPMLSSGVADRVVVINTWHHIPERVAYGRKLVAGLKPGGAVVVVDYTMEAEDGPPKEMRLAPEVIMAELKEAGLSVELAEESLPRQYVVIGRLPQ